MPPSAKTGGKAPEHTLEESRYLRSLIDKQIPVTVKLSDGETISGLVEYFDARFIRITRGSGPNLFIFKHDIKYLLEAGKRS